MLCFRSRLYILLFSAIPPPVLASFPSIVPQFMDSAPNSGTSSPVPTDSQDTPPAKVCPIFKDPNFIVSTIWYKLFYSAIISSLRKGDLLIRSLPKEQPHTLHSSLQFS